MATNAQRLEEVKDAIHRLATGQHEVSISNNGHSVTYSQMDLSTLQAEKRRLEIAVGVSPQRRSIRPVF